MSDSWNPISGDLVYVPSHVDLKRIHHGHAGLNSVTEFLRLEEPATMLVAEAAGESVQVVYRGTKWMVELKHAYPVRSEEKRQ